MLLPRLDESISISYKMRLSSVAAILCCSVKVITIVRGLYQAEITLFQYNNTPPGKCHDYTNFIGVHPVRGCCDDPTNNDTCHGDDLCDVYFTYCLRPFGSTGSGCSNYTNVTSSVKNDTSSFSFPQQDMNVLGLPNPLLLPGLTDAYTDEGVQLYIEIRDDDTANATPDDLVDTLSIDHNESVGKESASQAHSGMYGFVSMELVINMTCIENFQGSDCSQCVPGFTGPDCQQIDYCIGVNCSGNGQCVNGMDDFNCSCDPGFTGEICQTNIDECVGVNCSENGWCVDGIDSFSCNCNAGYTGMQCEVNVDDCTGVNCPGSGWCVDGVDSFSCNCSAGYTGTQCEVNINDCVGVNCSGNGECLDEVNSFTCECSPGYTGPLCDNQVNSNSLIGPSVGGIVGGVIGTILVVIVVIVILVLVVTVARRQSKKQGETNSHDKQRGFQAVPGNNPVYELQEQSIPIYTSPGFQYERNGPEKDQERVRGNPFSGGDETNDPVYTTPSGNKIQEAMLEHKFDNIIYGYEPEVNAYSVISDPTSTTAVYDTVTDKEH